MLDKLVAEHNTFLFIFFTLVAVLIVISFYLGRKRNLALTRKYSREIEASLKPKDQTYTWIGGAIGFRADYETKGKFLKVEATCTLLPRHSVLYYPIARFISGFDRLYVLFRLKKEIKEEAHILESWYGKSRGPNILNRPDLYSEQIDVGSKKFEILFQSSQMNRNLKTFLQGFEYPNALKHLAVNPGSQTVFLLIIPKTDRVKSCLDHAVKIIDLVQ